MLAIRVGLKCLPSVRFISTRSAVISKLACSSNKPTTRSKAVLCSHITPKMTKLAAEAAEAEISTGFLTKRLTSTKKCPKFCSYLDRQCPPLVPPIVKPKLPKDMKGVDQAGIKISEKGKKPAGADVPYVAVMAYRLAIFGAKLGIAGYIIKWTIAKGIWGSNVETSEMWSRFSSGMRSNSPKFHVINGAADEESRTLIDYWNRAVIATFDATVDAARWIRCKVVYKERELYGLSEDDVKNIGIFETLKSNINSVKSCWTKIKSEMEEDLDIIKPIEPDTPEYYGTKPGSSLTEIEPESSLENEKSSTDMQDEGAGNKSSEESNESKDVNTADENNDTGDLVPESQESDTKVADKTHSDENQARADLRKRCCHHEMIEKLGAEGRSVQELPAPCPRPDCPFHALHATRQAAAQRTSESKEITTEVN